MTSIFVGLSFQLNGALASGEQARVVLLGDSLMSGYGLPSEDGFAAQMQRWLDRYEMDVKIVNGSQAGDTTTGGLARLDWLLSQDVDALVVGLGANDFLRGIDPQITRANIEQILQKVRLRGIPVLLMGMRSIANYGPDYAQRFNRIYPELATKYGAILYPWFLEEVAIVPELNQADGIHPNRQGVARIVELTGPYFVELVRIANKQSTDR